MMHGHTNIKFISFCLHTDMCDVLVINLFVIVKCTDYRKY